MKDPLNFYREVITETFVDELLEAATVVHRDGIFKASIVIWLMIVQRLKPKQTLAKALEDLRYGASQKMLERAPKSIRARTSRISGSTGGYSQARERIPTSVVEGVVDKLQTSIEAQWNKSNNNDLGVYVIDGSTLQINYSKENIVSYPQSNSMPCVGMLN